MEIKWRLGLARWFFKHISSPSACARWALWSERYLSSQGLILCLLRVLGDQCAQIKGISPRSDEGEDIHVRMDRHMAKQACIHLFTYMCALTQTNTHLEIPGFAPQCLLTLLVWITITDTGPNPAYVIHSEISGAAVLFLRFQTFTLILDITRTCVP